LVNTLIVSSKNCFADLFSKNFFLNNNLMSKYKIEIKQPFAVVKTQYIDFMFENYHLLTAEDLVS